MLTMDLRALETPFSSVKNKAAVKSTFGSVRVENKLMPSCSTEKFKERI